MTTPGRLSGKRCLITGGSRGLGRALGLAFAREGAKVAFTYSRKDEDAAETQRLLGQLGAESLVFKGSVADAAHAQAAVTGVQQAWGGLDVLVNNAATTQVLPMALLEERDWDQVMAVNVKGPYLFSRAALKPMIKARAGHILNVGSFASDRIMEAPVHYAASKAALRGMTEALAKEVGKYGVRVNLLAPGLLDVGMALRLPQHRVVDYSAQAALGRVGTADELAKMAVFLVSDENSFMSGARIAINGGI